MSTCLVTGGAGNLACQLSWLLTERFERVVLFDVAASPVGRVAPRAIFETRDLTDKAELQDLFRRHSPDAVVHLASLLSGSCEADHERAWSVNATGTFLLLETALAFGSPTVLFASSVAAYGGRLPDVLRDDTPQWPDGLYGVTKVTGERLGVYYQRRHGLDFRCLRLPITISRFAPPGAASALASQAFIETVRRGGFTFRSQPDTPLALIYAEDVVQAFGGILAASPARLTQRVYNLHAMTATSREIAAAILGRIPDADLRFEPDPQVAALLASWPGSIDDSAARRDWGWMPQFDLPRTADHFLAELRQ